MNENYDVLPEGAADAYESYLDMVKESMDDLMARANGLNDELDDHDRNAFTEKMSDNIQALAGQIQGMAAGMGEITDKLLRELDEKNDKVNSSLQADYINQIRTAAQRLPDIETYREANLGGKKSFSESEKEDFSGDLGDLTDEWEEAVHQMQQQAQELKDENEQNELSGVYAEISELLDGFLNRMAEQIENIGSHLQDIEESYQGRKSRMNDTAEESAQELLNTLNSQLEETVGDFAGFSF